MHTSSRLHISSSFPWFSYHSALLDAVQLQSLRWEWLLVVVLFVIHVQTSAEMVWSLLKGAELCNTSAEICKVIVSSFYVQRQLPSQLSWVGSWMLRLGQHGVICLCVKPLYLVHLLNAWELNGLPLSVFITCEYPNFEGTMSTTGIVVFADTDFVTRYLEYSSMMTTRYSPVESVPQESIQLRCPLAFLGINSNMFKGSICSVPSYVVWQQFLIYLWTPHTVCWHAEAREGTNRLPEAEPNSIFWNYLFFSVDRERLDWLKNFV